MLFPLREDYIGPFTGNAVGTQITKEITREFLIDSLDIIVSGTVTTGATTSTPDGILNAIKRITLQVTDGARTRNVVDCSGSGLIHYATRTSNIDALTAAQLAQPTAQGTGAFQINYHVPFRIPHIDDPESSAFLLPVNRYANNPLLTIFFGAQSDIDQANSPAFAITGGFTVSIIINRRQVNVDEWPVYDAELIEQNVAFPSSGANQFFELPTPGAYTGILIRGYTGAAPSAAYSYLVTSGGDYRLQVLGTVLRRIQPAFLQVQNDQAIGAIQLGKNPPPNVNTVVGVTYLDFLDVSGGRTIGDFGSVLDANGLPAAGARVQLGGDINGGTGAHLNFLWHRVFGDISPLKASLKMQAAVAASKGG